MLSGNSTQPEPCSGQSSPKEKKKKENVRALCTHCAHTVHPAPLSPKLSALGDLRGHKGTYAATIRQAPDRVERKEGQWGFLPHGPAYKGKESLSWPFGSLFNADMPPILRLKPYTAGKEQPSKHKGPVVLLALIPKSRCHDEPSGPLGATVCILAKEMSCDWGEPG